MVVGLLICTFDRPDYLRQCLDSIRRAKIPPETKILIVDDCSTDEETKRLIIETNYSVLRKSENKSIKDSLLQGCDYLFSQGVDAITNLDGDAIVRSDFIKVLLDLKFRFYDHLITGFNCLTRNKDGSERHKVIMQGNDYNLKKSVGGLNMLFDKSQYDKWVRPALVKSLEQNLNWDDHTCRASMADGKEIVCSTPSVCQHIGEVSAMNHSAGGEPMDKADDFIENIPVLDVETEKIKRAIEKQNKKIYKQPVSFENGETGFLEKLHLPDVTLVCADGFDVERCIRAVNVSCRGIEFGMVKILSHLPSNDSIVIKIRPLLSKQDYSVFMMKEIVDYIDTPYFMTIQWDGYILRADQWNNDWYNYDFIGSPWEWYTDGMNVGNGAASFRSLRLHQILKGDANIIPTNDHLIKECQEDHNIARIYRRYLEEHYHVKFAPIEVARRFGIEAWDVKPPGNKYDNQFCFHGRHVDFSDAKISHIPY